MINLSLDERIANIASQTPESMKLDTKPLKPPYKVGETVQVRINHIVDYGAFAQILQDGKETGYTGLIHKKNISSLYVDEVKDWVYLGQELEARIQEITKDYKINLSVVHLKLKPLEEYNNPFHLLKDVTNFPNEREEESKEENSPVYQEQSATISDVETYSSEDIKEQELQSIYQHLSTSLGILSPKTKQILREMVQEKGVFQTTVAIMEAMQEFEVDLSYHFVKVVQQKLGDGL